MKNQNAAPPSKRMRLVWAVMLVLIGVGAGLAITLLVFVMVIEPRRAVAQVRRADGSLVVIRTKEFQDRLRFEREREIAHAKTEGLKHGAKWDWMVQIDYRRLSSFGFAAGVLERMTDEILIREAAARQHLNATDAEVDQLLKEIDAESRVKTEAGTTAASQTTSVVIAVPHDALPANYREILRTELLERKLRAAMLDQIPRQQDAVKLRFIRFETEKDARAAAAEVGQGMTFDELYRRAQGGYLNSAYAATRDWSSAAEVTRDLGDGLEAAVFRLSVGQHLASPVAAAHGWYLAEVSGHEVHACSDDWRRARANDAFVDWRARQESRVTEFPVWMSRVPIMDEAWQQRDFAAPLPPRLPSNQPLAGSLAAPGTGVPSTSAERGAPRGLGAMPSTPFSAMGNPLGQVSRDNDQANPNAPAENTASEWMYR